MGRLRDLNPGAEIHLTTPDTLKPQIVLDTDTDYDPLKKSIDVQIWLKAEAYRQVHVYKDSPLSRKPVSLMDDINRHDKYIDSFFLTFDQPVPLHGLTTALPMLF